MAFADDFAQALQAAGVPIDASDVPPQETLEAGLASLQSWLGSLDETTSSALDEVTADFPVKVGLSDPAVNIAPGLGTVMRAFDSVPASISASAVLATCRDALKVAVDGQAQV